MLLFLRILNPWSTLDFYRIVGPSWSQYYKKSSIYLGELSDNHDILSMKLFELEDNEAGPVVDRSKLVPSSSVFESPRDHVDDPKPSSMSGVKLFFLLLLGVLGCFACVVIGIMIYQKQQENSRKRFYWLQRRKKSKQPSLPDQNNAVMRYWWHQQSGQL